MSIISVKLIKLRVGPSQRGRYIGADWKPGTGWIRGTLVFEIENPLPLPVETVYLTGLEARVNEDKNLLFKDRAITCQMKGETVRKCLVNWQSEDTDAVIWKFLLRLKDKYLKGEKPKTPVTLYGRADIFEDFPIDMAALTSLNIKQDVIVYESLNALFFHREFRINKKGGTGQGCY